MNDARISDHSAWAARGIWNKAYDCAIEELTALRAQLAESRQNARWAYVQAALEDNQDELVAANARADLAEAALAAQDWQPIETAPTDYTHVIGIDAKGCVARTWFFAPSSLTREWLRVGLPGKAVWHPTQWKPFRDADLPATDAQALANDKVQALVDAAKGVMRHMPDYADTAWQDLEDALAAYEGMK